MKEIKAYRCDYCGKLGAEEDVVQSHEKVCGHNPERMTCITCEWAYDYRFPEIQCRNPKLKDLPIFLERQELRADGGNFQVFVGRVREKEIVNCPAWEANATIRIKNKP